MLIVLSYESSTQPKHLHGWIWNILTRCGGKSHQCNNTRAFEVIWERPMGRHSGDEHLFETQNGPLEFHCACVMKYATLFWYTLILILKRLRGPIWTSLSTRTCIWTRYTFIFNQSWKKWPCLILTHSSSALFNLVEYLSTWYWVFGSNSQGDHTPLRFITTCNKNLLP